MNSWIRGSDSRITSSDRMGSAAARAIVNLDRLVEIARMSTRGG